MKSCSPFFLTARVGKINNRPEGANDMKLTELFEKMAVRAGIAKTDAKYTEAMALIPADAEIDDDVVAKPLTENLITIAEAEAMPKIKSKFTAEALNGLDALLDPALSDFFDETELAAIKADKGTGKKLAKLIEKAKTLKTAGGTTTDVQKTLTDLNNEISKLKTDKDMEIGTLKSQYERERYFDKLATKVIARNDVTDYAKAKEGRRVISDFQDTLDSVGGVLDLTTGKVMQKGDPSLKLFIDNKEVDVDGLMQKTLTDNDYIKKSDGAAPVTTIQTQGKADGEPPISEAQRRNAERLKTA